MPARSTWKGYLKISLVSIPIKVFPATDAQATLSFNQLHARVSDAHSAEALVPALRARGAQHRDREGLRIRERAATSSSRKRTSKGPRRIDPGHQPREVHRRRTRSTRSTSSVPTTSRPTARWRRKRSRSFAKG